MKFNLNFLELGKVFEWKFFEVQTLFQRPFQQVPKMVAIDCPKLQNVIQ